MPLPTASVLADETVTYTYDALSRLVQTSSSGTVNNGVVTTIAFDPAGNRAMGIPAAPASVFGPSGQNTTGNYTISWSSSAGATRYELWENDYDGPFFMVYDGPNTSKSFSNKPSGEYMYKAKACNAVGCSGFSPTKFVLVCRSSCNSPNP